MIKRLLATYVFLFASSAFAAPNLTGQWKIHNNIAGNENDQECKLVVIDNKITGSCRSQDKDLPVTGTVDGSKVTWQYQWDYNGSPLTLIYSATLDDSGKIAGTVEVQPFGVTGNFTATPGAAPSPSASSLSASPPAGSSESQSDPQCAYLKNLDMNSPSIVKSRDYILKPGMGFDWAALSKNPDFAEAMKRSDQQDQARKAADWAALCYYKADNAANASKAHLQVVFMGDSITELWQFGDPSLFSAGVLDRGISGQTTSQILLRFYADAVAIHPSVVHLMAGTNDVAQNTGPISDEDILNNIRAMIDLAEANHIKVVLASILPMAKVSWRPSITPGARVASLNEQLRTLASKMGVQFVDYYSALKDAKGGLRADYSNDGVHPNLNGYSVMHPIAERALKDASAMATAQAWQISPFTRPAQGNPVVKPNRESTFVDPVLKTRVHWEASHTFNPAAIVKDGKVVVLYRAEDDSGKMGLGMHTSRLGIALSEDGVHFTRQAEPVFFPAEDGEKAREWPGGVEDPRLVESEDGAYVLTYTQWNRQIARLAVATSNDLIHWTKYGPAFQEALGGKYASRWSKSAGIVTRLDETKGRLIAAKIDGKYWMYWGEGTVYLATSTDLIHWTPVENEKGGLQVLLASRAGRFDSTFPEGGPPPVLTKDGIVLIYNGRNAEKDGDPKLGASAYAAGEALFDAHAPAKMLARTDEPVLKPELSYEKTGQYVAGTTFSEGLVYFKGQWMIYYGCADSLVSVAMAPAGQGGVA
jgi:beta-1,2-mannosidase